MPAIDAYLEQAVQMGASDLHLGADSKAYARVMGELKPITPRPS